MKNLRRRFDRFCFQYRDKGISNLMLYIVLGTALVYLMTMATRNYVLYEYLVFDRALILKGQIWRLFTYPLTDYNPNVLMMLIMLFCYYSLGKAVENVWGTLRFNLFYLCGILLLDVYCMIFGIHADASYLHLSLLLSYATLFPDTSFLILFIIPVKAWILAMFYLALTFYDLLFTSFPYNLFSVISLGNYFLFFGKDVLRIVPISWQVNFRRLFNRQKKGTNHKTIIFPSAGSYQATVATVKPDYNHKCTVCGRTDVTNPELEFRYCSRCSGYHCYCQDHISNHTHIQS